MLIIILTAYLVLIDYPGMTIGKIMYHVMLFANVSAPIRQLHRIYDDMNDALIYAEGFFGILHAEEEVEDSGTHHPEEVKGDFELNDVDFTYSNGTQALHGVTMHIESGKITALVGLSGAGKSTIVSLLDKFYHPGKGSIRLDGVELRDWDTKWLRANVGLVLQKNHIFDGTIEENIKYGNPHATHDQVVEAAKKAYIYDQVMQLPNGFDTHALQLPRRTHSKPRRHRHGTNKGQHRRHQGGADRGHHLPQHRANHRRRQDICPPGGTGRAGWHAGRGVQARRHLQGHFRRQRQEHERGQNSANHGGWNALKWTNLFICISNLKS